MDFELDDRQRALLAALDAAVTEGGVARAFAVSSENGYDAELDATLRATLRSALSGAAPSRLESVLVAERLAELGTATTIGVGLAIQAAGGPGPDAAATVIGPTGLARFGAHARIAVIERPRAVDVVHLADGVADSVRSGFGFPYARIDPARLDGALVAGVVEHGRWHEALTLVRAAEIAGAAQAAVATAAEQLRQRRQFGRPLATLQALRHRLAEAAVSAAACRWLVREAAYTGTARAVAVAAQYAQWTAATVAPELVQLGGARSFARECGWHVHTMRLEAVRLELGGPDRLAAAVNATPLPAEVGNGR